MPLKEIAVSPVGLDQKKTDEVKLCPLDGNKENNLETSKQKNLDKTNAAFDEDPKDTTKTESEIPQDGTSESKTSVTKTSATKTKETNISQDKRTVAMFTVSLQKKNTDPEDSSGKSQSSSRILSRNSSSQSSVSVLSLHNDICRICHCEGDEESPLITPCLCLGSLKHVHQACVQQWIKSSNTKACELCRFPFVMQTKLKPIGKWEKLDMTTSERRKIICSVSFHIIAITCVVWALYVLIDRTTTELQQSGGVKEWPFWTKLVVVAIGFTGGLVFMYVQCKVYLQLWRRLRAYNRVIYVQNCPPDERLKAKQAMVVPEAPQPQVEIIT